MIAFPREFLSISSCLQQGRSGIPRSRNSTVISALYKILYAIGSVTHLLQQVPPRCINDLHFNVCDKDFVTFEI